MLRSGRRHNPTTKRRLPTITVCRARVARARAANPVYAR
jgi:hypothetical protein